MRNKEKVKEYNRRYRKTLNGKKAAKRSYTKWRKSETGLKTLKRISEYRKTPIGRKDNKKNTRNSNLKRLYGITPTKFDQLKLEQDNRCKICLQNFISTPCIDHDHITGKIRGLLCRNCNAMLGLAGDNSIILKNAIDYLHGG